jgi:membrane protein DedA with SNARE-associated domain
VDLSVIQLAEHSALIQQWGYLLVFMAMLVENAGIPIPGETVTLLGGYAAGHGQINPFGVMVAAAGGAVLGDNIGFWIGRHYGWRVIVRMGRMLRQNSDQLDRLKQGFLRRAGLSVFLGRFVALLRVLAGPLAGAAGMPYKKFLICNAAGAILWSSVMVSIAWLSGKWIPIGRLIDVVSQAGLIGLVIVVLLILLAWIVNRSEASWLERSRKKTQQQSHVDDKRR